MWPAKADQVTGTEPSVLEMAQLQSPSQEGDLLQEKSLHFVEQALVKSHIHSSHGSHLPAVTWFRTSPACSQVGSLGLVTECQWCCKDHISMTSSQAKAALGACTISYGLLGFTDCICTESIRAGREKDPVCCKARCDVCVEGELGCW